MIMFVIQSLISEIVSAGVCDGLEAAAALRRWRWVLTAAATRQPNTAGDPSNSLFGIMNIIFFPCMPPPFSMFPRPVCLPCIT